MKRNSMMLKAVTPRATTTDTPTGCQFPLDNGGTCEAEVMSSGKPGAPRKYCDNPDHTAQKALRRKRKADDKTGKRTEQRPSRPVTDGMNALADLVDRIELTRVELAAMLVDAGELIAEVTDPAVIDREIAEIRRDATVRIAAAEQARDDAEKAATVMARRLERAVELEELALAAADEAAEETQEAKDLAAQAATDAQERIAEVEADRDRVYEEAEAVLKEMRRHLDAARAAQAHAEGERDAAVTNAKTSAEENATLRQRLDDQANEHHHQLEQRDVEYSRAITAAHAMADRAAREHRDQVSEILRTYRGQLSPMHTDRQVEQCTVAADSVVPQHQPTVR
ncbi:hypothetical protein OIE68_32030 [Nocardia vinacea]|uniref:hypothetical protein n=1 Tax=Nocardia vinacea TaxID=96468 RepID=UPI002E10715F|nr:hypothetical protein OIE68_32030 [Nocardia vinacea]